MTKFRAPHVAIDAMGSASHPTPGAEEVLEEMCAPSPGQVWPPRVCDFRSLERRC